MQIKLLCLVFCFVIFLSGCGGGKEVQTDIKFDFELEAKNGTFFINAEVLGENMKYTVLSPENISGLTFVLREDNAEIEFMNHKKSFPRGSEDFGVLGSLYSAFSALKGAEAVKSGDKFIAEVTAEGKNFTFTVTELGLPLSVKFGDTEIFFKNITNL